MKISYNWLKWYIPEAPNADKLADVITYHLAEVETVEKREDGDSIFDIKILPNRAHDLLSHMGVGRELASLLNISYMDPTPKYKIPESKPTNLKISIATKKDRRHMGRIIRNVKVGPSPEWVVNHLASIGQRSINNIVDATNLVMFNCGQPMHAFDLNKVEGSQLIIRDAKPGDRIVLLTGEEKELKEGMVAICDKADHILDTGIKGGKHAEITGSTTDLLVEADNFEPVFARKTGQALNIVTDARKRFENDLSPELVPYGMRELSALVAEMCPEAVFEDVVDTYPQKQEVKKLSFRTEKISKILGLDVSISEIKDILKRYNIEYTESAGTFEITIPPMRLDIQIEEDMAEEIGRIIGYDKVKPVLPKINFEPKENEIFEKIKRAKSKLFGEGYSEVMTYTFRDKGEVEVMQSASDKKFLRTNLSDGLKESLKLNKLNAPLLGLNEVKIFEIGTVFQKDKERIHVAFNEKENVKETTLDEFSKDMSSDLKLEAGNYNSFEPEGSQSLNGLEGKFNMWSLFPFIARDVAVWVPEGLGSSEILKVIKENAGDMVVREPELFDKFKKNGKVSYAFRTVFQSYERTLTDTEVNDTIAKIADKLKEKGWEVR